MKRAWNAMGGTSWRRWGWRAFLGLGLVWSAVGVGALGNEALAAIDRQSLSQTISVEVESSVPLRRISLPSSQTTVWEGKNNDQILFMRMKPAAFVGLKAAQNEWQKIVKRAGLGAQSLKDEGCKTLRAGTMKCKLTGTRKTSRGTQSVLETYFWNRFDDVALLRVSTLQGEARLRELKKSVRVKIKGVKTS